MKLHGQFGRDTDDKKPGKSWHWLRNGNLKQEAQTLLSAAQEQALNTNSVWDVCIQVDGQIEHWRADYGKEYKKMFDNCCFVSHR